MIKTKFVDPLITRIEKENLKKAINSGWFSAGPYVEKFEKKLSNTELFLIQSQLFDNKQ